MELAISPASVGIVANNVGLLKPTNDPDFCHHMRRDPVWLDIKKVLRDYAELEQLSAGSLSLRDIEPKLKTAYKNMPDEAFAYLRTLGPDIHEKLSSLLIVASYDKETMTSWIQHCKVLVNERFEPFVSDQKLDQINQSHECMFYRLGEQEYADRNLQPEGSIGRQFLKQSTLQFLTTPRPVREVDKQSAIDAAVDFIHAVSATAERVPPPSGIGGPIDVLFLGADSRPERIQWKTVAP